MLTDRCKIEFDEWFYKEYSSQSYWDMWFSDEEFPFTMKYGVYVEYFDSVGIIIDVQPFLYYNENVYTSVQFYIASVHFSNVKTEEDDEDSVEFKTRKEAQEQAIIKADKIFNNLND